MYFADYCKVSNYGQYLYILSRCYRQFDCNLFGVFNVSTMLGCKYFKIQFNSIKNFYYLVKAFQKVNLILELILNKFILQNYFYMY